MYTNIQNSTLLNQRAYAINLFEEAAARYGEGFERLSWADQKAIIDQVNNDRLKQSKSYNYEMQKM